MSSKLKKSKKWKFPLTQNNQAAQAFGRAMLNYRSQIEEVEKQAYEDGFAVGEDWSNTIITSTIRSRKFWCR